MVFSGLPPIWLCFMVCGLRKGGQFWTVGEGSRARHILYIYTISLNSFSHSWSHPIFCLEDLAFVKICPSVSLTPSLMAKQIGNSYQPWQRQKNMLRSGLSCNKIKKVKQAPLSCTFHPVKLPSKHPCPLKKQPGRSFGQIFGIYQMPLPRCHPTCKASKHTSESNYLQWTGSLHWWHCQRHNVS